MQCLLSTVAAMVMLIAGCSSLKHVHLKGQTNISGVCVGGEFAVDMQNEHSCKELAELSVEMEKLRTSAAPILYPDTGLPDDPKKGPVFLPDGEMCWCWIKGPQTGECSCCHPSDLD